MKVLREGEQDRRGAVACVRVAAKFMSLIVA